MTGTNNPIHWTTSDEPEKLESIPLSLEETGWLCHLLMGEAMRGAHNFLLQPRHPRDLRLVELYKKLSDANDRLMGKVPE